MHPLISRRALNRATLDRQFLLRRTTRSVTDVVEHLGGLQAQTPHTWYTGLWSRIEEFKPDDAAGLLSSRQLVRIALQRSTIHLVTARDCLAMRPLLQVVGERAAGGAFGRRPVRPARRSPPRRGHPRAGAATSTRSRSRTGPPARERSAMQNGVLQNRLGRYGGPRAGT
ncbi:hypothetical protein E1267_38900 [Nonomuraea longispora]|uniref:Winged helix DNA-binding domain-containing protein n=1 Tax=Nonomuraea longispora TaxID=1848320 RepID=A0A4R4MUS2_9ACTN|nr:crosslink repair DNA glycosylase YcaQ family protein [Nonomuraea longispora]TDB98262.1 hypothetical protein E1267_38900 [Nonomuraea longispora]